MTTQDKDCVAIPSAGERDDFAFTTRACSGFTGWLARDNTGAIAQLSLPIVGSGFSKEARCRRPPKAP